MRIALCSDIYLPQLSGVADSIDLLAAALAARRHTVRIYAPAIAGAEPDPSVVRLKSWDVPGSGGGIRIVRPSGMGADLATFRPDVIHSHTCGPVGLAAFAAGRKLKVPRVGTDHTLPAHYLHYARLDVAPMRYAVRRFAAWYYQRAVVVTAPSRMMLDELQAYGLTRANEVVSNPIPTDRFRPLRDRAGAKRRLGIGPEAVLVFGRIAAEKNLDLAVDAFADVSARRPAAELMIIGDGPARPALAAMLADRGVAERVRWMGVLRGEPLVEAINAADLCLVTSRSETQSMSTLQAAACGLPVVAMRAGGLPEYVRDGVMGFVVDDGDRKGLAAAMMRLLDDRVLTLAFGQAGRDFVLDLSPARISARFEAIYARARNAGCGVA